MVEDIRDASRDFKSSAGPAAEPVLVAIDADIADWFRSQGNLRRQVNDLCRFYMDTGFSKEVEFDPDLYEQHCELPIDPPGL